MPLGGRPLQAPVRGRTLAGLATGGIVIGHLLGYLTAFRSERHQNLAAVGHGSFHLVWLPALALAGISLMALGGRALRGERAIPVGRTALVLGTLQICGFLLIELVERHLELAATLADPGVQMGLLMQVLVALAIEVVLHGFVRAVCVVGASLRRRFQAAIIPPRPSATLSRVGADLLVGVRRRAPPTPLPS